MKVVDWIDSIKTISFSAQTILQRCLLLFFGKWINWKDLPMRIFPHPTNAQSHALCTSYVPNLNHISYFVTSISPQRMTLNNLQSLHFSTFWWYCVSSLHLIWQIPPFLSQFKPTSLQHSSMSSSSWRTSFRIYSHLVHPYALTSSTLTIKYKRCES